MTLRHFVLSEALLPIQQYFDKSYEAALNLTKGARPSLKFWLTKYGVLSDTTWASAAYTENSSGLHYAWERNGVGYEPGTIVTIWTEEVLSGDDGIWHFWDWLKPEFDEYGKARDSAQIERMRERARLLRDCYDQKLSFDALLLENKKTRDELRMAKKPVSAIHRSVRDDVQWQVADWDELRQRAFLVRGPRAPKISSVSDSATTSEGSVAQPHLVFPDQALRDKVESAAVDAVKKEFSEFDIKSREHENLGYDLDLISKVTGKVVYRVEVKGTSGDTPHFFITRNERCRAMEDNLWRLVIVTNALAIAPNVGHPLRWKEVDEVFRLDPLVWHAGLKNDS